MAEALLAIDRLNKRFLLKDGVWGREHGQVVAARDVSLTVERGETLGLVGESGCGKTTVGKALLRLVEPTAGSVALDGEPITARNVAAIQMTNAATSAATIAPTGPAFSPHRRGKKTDAA